MGNALTDYWLSAIFLSIMFLSIAIIIGTANIARAIRLARKGE